MSVDQFHEVTDYDERFTYELVQGAVFVSPFPETAERAASQTLAYRLREFHERRDEYFASGACEYWLFDRSSRSMIVYSQFEGVSRETLVKDGDTYSTELLPGFNLRLADMFAAADQWAAKE